MIPKKPMESREEYARIRAEMSPVLDLSKIRSRSYGASYLLDSIQRRICLGEDLHRSFGTSAKAIMTCAMALTINPSPFSSISSTFENTYLRDLYGTEVLVDSREMSRFTTTSAGPTCVWINCSNAASKDVTGWSHGTPPTVRTVTSEAWRNGHPTRTGRS